MNGKTDAGRPFSQQMRRGMSAGQEAPPPWLADRPSAGLSGEQWRAVGTRLRLSTRQLQIVQLILDGRHEEEIARKLGIKRPTVHTYVGRIYRKLDAHSHRDVVVRVMLTCLSLSSTLERPPAPPGEG